MVLSLSLDIYNISVLDLKPHWVMSLTFPRWLWGLDLELYDRLWGPTLGDVNDCTATVHFILFYPFELLGSYIWFLDVLSAPSHFVLFIIFTSVKLWYLYIFIYLACINRLLFFYCDKWMNCVFLNLKFTRVFAYTWWLSSTSNVLIILGCDISNLRT
jgi:hypothetical protein